MQESRLKSHFEQFGEVKLLKMVRNRKTQEPLGFAFVEYSNEKPVQKVLEIQHLIDDREVKVYLLRLTSNHLE